LTEPTHLRGDFSESFARVCQLLSELVLGKSPDNLTRLLNDIPPMLGLKHLAYVRVEKARSNDVVILSALATYPKEWQLRYFTRRYSEIDPFFLACLHATSPFDWRSIRDASLEASPQLAAFFSDAADHGLGGNGFTIPVPDMSSGYGILSFNSSLSDADWEAYKDLYMGQLELVACLIDAAAIRNARLPSKKIDLSKREHQALTWSARGRTASEIAEILGVSYATARSHLEGARRKLECENVTHAVATALAIGLISPIALKGFDPVGYSGKE
jgi:LuxR family transcriptional regulator, quorum-sensing system regulator CinR